MLDRKFLRSLEKVVGRRFVLTEPADVLLYSYDSSTARGTPDAVVLPASTEEVARVVRLCARDRVPFVARGAGTNLSGGSVPVRQGLVIGLSRMNRILQVDLPNQRALVQPGVVNLQLQNHLAPSRFQFCPDPASQKASTLGGNIAENSGGPHCLKYGVTTNHVAGLTVVLPSGEVRQFGGPALDTPGYDLVGLFIGSEGTFGVCTEMLVKLRPLAEAAQVVLALFDHLETAGEAVTEIIGSGIVATALEIMDRNTIHAVEASFPTGIPLDVEAMLLIEVDGLTEAIDRQAERCADICRRLHARSVELGRTAEERAKLWVARKSAFGATARLSPSMLTNDSTVPRTRIPEALRGIEEIEHRHGIQIAKVFHAGDGNLHCNLLYDIHDPKGQGRAEVASEEIFALAARVGGTISGEHGVGLEKPHHLHLIFSEQDLEAQRRLKRVFDPEGLANPGKVLPDGNSRSQIADSRERRGGGTTSSPDLRRLEAVVGEKHLVTATGGVAGVREGVSDYAVDGQMPLAAAFPGSEAEVAGLLRECTGSGLSVLPRGAGRHLYLGATPGPIGLVMSLARLDQVVAYDAEDLTVSVQAGMTLGTLRRLVAEHGQLLPLDPPGPDEATVGGVVAANLAGPLRMRYGAPRDLVLGLKVALSDGEIVKTGGRTVKNVAGYDLTKLFVGSFGTVGALLEVTLRLVPAPEAGTTVVAAMALAEARVIVPELLGGSLDIATCDVLNHAAARALGSHLPLSLQPGGVVLVLGLQGAREAVARQERDLRRIGAVRAEGEEVSGFVREAASPPLGGALLRVCVPLAAVLDLVELASASAGERVVARAGDGVVYVAPPAGRSSEEVVATFTALRAAAEARGGHAILESGPVEVKRCFSVWGMRSANADLLHGLKEAFDPGGVFVGRGAGL